MVIIDSNKTIDGVDVSVHINPDEPASISVSGVGFKFGDEETTVALLEMESDQTTEDEDNGVWSDQDHNKLYLTDEIPKISDEDDGIDHEAAAKEQERLRKEAEEKIKQLRLELESKDHTNTELAEKFARLEQEWENAQESLRGSVYQGKQDS